MYFSRYYTIGDLWMRVYYMRCACTPSSTCVTYSRVRPSCKLIFNFVLLWLNLSAIIPNTVAAIIYEKAPTHSLSKLPVWIQLLLVGDAWKLNKNSIFLISIHIISLHFPFRLASIKCRGEHAIYSRLKKNFN